MVQDNNNNCEDNNIVRTVKVVRIIKTAAKNFIKVKIDSWQSVSH